MKALDEEDNPNEEYNPKTINRLIRQLLNIHEKNVLLVIQQHHLQIYLFMKRALLKSMV